MRFDLRTRSIGVVLVLCVGLPGHGAPYTFTLIASTGGEFEWFNVPALNDSGTVTFRVGNSGDVYVSDGSAPILMGKSGFNEGPSINNLGTVAFGADAQGYSLVTVTADGHHIPIVLPGEHLALFLGHSLNDAGTVAFHAIFTPPVRPFRHGVFAGNGGPLTTIIDGSGLFWTILYTVINNQGMVAFTTISLTPTRERVFIGDGGAVEPIVESPSGFVISSLSMNNEGALVVVMTDGWNPTNGFIAMRDGESLATVADSSGPLSVLRSVAVNDDGNVVFQASLDCGGVVVLSGHDPVVDRVIGTGDQLFGSTVLSVGFRGHGAANNIGQIAFVAWSEDGAGYIVRADPTAPMPRPNLHIGTCNTLVEDKVLDSGCSMSALIMFCADGAQNHGEFVSCVTHLTNDWQQEELISQEDRTSIQTCAARSKLRKPSHEVLLPLKQPLRVRGQR